MAKTSAIPKTLVEPARRRLYERALLKVQQHTELNISDFIRRAVDAEAAKALGMEPNEFRRRWVNKS